MTTPGDPRGTKYDPANDPPPREWKREEVTPGDLQRGMSMLRDAAGRGEPWAAAILFELERLRADQQTYADTYARNMARLRAEVGRLRGDKGDRVTRTILLADGLSAEAVEAMARAIDPVAWKEWAAPGKEDAQAVARHAARLALDAALAALPLGTVIVVGEDGQVTCSTQEDVWRAFGLHDEGDVTTVHLTTATVIAALSATDTENEHHRTGRQRPKSTG